jgi:branched-chain amino acid transport system substrate-binding protein
MAAAFRMANEQGGFAGRKVVFLSYDDAYSPPKSVEQVRRLIEEDKVAALFGTLGSPTNSATWRYVNQKQVPHLFLTNGLDKWANYQEHPWTIGWQPSYFIEGRIYGTYILEQEPNAKIGILHQNDDFGKDYVRGIRDVLKDRYDRQVTSASYEVTDPKIDSQLISLHAAGAEVLLTLATPKFATQSIRKVADMGWRPLHFLSSSSASVGAVMNPAGPDNGIGIISAAFMKDPTDPRWDNDDGIRQWRDFMAKYYPEGDLKDIFNVAGFGLTHTMLHVLRQCGEDLSRENMMRQATHLRQVENPILLPGIRINTSQTDYRPIKQLQLMRWTGKTWDLFGNVKEGA